MITLIEALNYRCLRYIRQPLGPFHVLVGPNASGKTTFLDIIAFLGRLVSDGLEAAVDERTQYYKDLIWGREGDGFELAIEAAIPEDRRKLLRDKDFSTIRYEISLGLGMTGKFIIKTENVLLMKPDQTNAIGKTDSPRDGNPPATIITSWADKKSRIVVTKNPKGNVIFDSEVQPEPGKGGQYSFKLGERKSAFGNLPDDESQFPAATWLKEFLVGGVQRFILNSLIIKKPSPAGQGRSFSPDGSNLPWVVDNLKKNHRENFDNWLAHVRTAFPDIIGIDIYQDMGGNHRYLMLCYHEAEVPSWMASDGTLRLLALTLPAYLPGLTGIFLIEEPENGIHPRAIETAYQSLSSVYGAQVLLATHSPVLLSMVKVNKVLCFSKAPTGGTAIILGSDHPMLKEWKQKGETDLGVLFASGVLD